jgi:membrane fusion protein, multidrug efflux system
MSVVACGGGESDQNSVADHADLSNVPAEVSTRVDVVTLSQSAATLELSMPGQIEAAHDALLGSAMGGFVEAVLVSAGDEVRAGALLARIDTELQVSRLAQATANALLAAAELERATQMGDLISPAALQAAETANVNAAASQRQAEIMVSRSRIRAPFAGVVGQVGAEAGEVLVPGSPVIRLVDLSSVEVSLSVSDRDVVSLEVGAAATVSLQADATTYYGEVTHISPVADRDTRSFEVKVTVDNINRTLFPGMIARVDVTQPLSDSVLVIPQDWIVTNLNGQGVFLESDGVARWRDLELGDVVRDQVVVESGIQAGDRAVVSGHRELADGDLLLVAREGTCCQDGRSSF